VNQREEERTITIKGIDEADSAHGEVSWIAPIARALLKSRVGDEVSFEAPGGLEELEVLDVRYPAPERPAPTR
jgi:transcription elongation factor GreB